MFKLWIYARHWASNVNCMVEKMYRYGTKMDIKDIDKEIVVANNALANLNGIQKKCKFVSKLFCDMTIDIANHTLLILEDVKYFLEDHNG